MRLTTRNTKSLKPGEYRDTQLPDLLFRVTPTSRAWGLRYTFAGQRRRARLGPLSALDPEKARALARVVVAGLARGDDPRITLGRYEADALTVPELCAKAISDLDLKPKTRADWRNHLARNIERQFRGVPAAQLNRAMIRIWGLEIRERGGYAANRAFEMLRRCYSWGVEKELLAASPFVNLPKPFDGEKVRRRLLSKEELVRLMAALDADNCGFADAVWLLLLTGVRKGSVDSMRPADIKGDVWTIPDTKNDLAHPVPLSRQALEVIARQKKRIPRRSVYLFPRLRPDAHARTPYSQVQNSYASSLHERVGGERWRLHDLRTTIATHLEDELGIDLRVISLILGHVPKDVPESTRAYALGQRLADRKTALQAWADWLDALRSGPPVAQA